MILPASKEGHAVYYYSRRRRRGLYDPAFALFRTHTYNAADTNIDTDDVFGDTAARTRSVTFAFALERTGTGAGIVFEFGSATRGVAVWVDGDDLGVAAGSSTADDGVTLTVADILPLSPAATATLTLTDNPLDGETVTVAEKTYIFQDTLTNVNGNVLIGASASDTLDNLIAAINLDAGGGTLYAAATTLNAFVSAAADVGDTMVVTAKIRGQQGNNLIVSESLIEGFWSGPTLRGGLPATRFVVSIIPGSGLLELYRNGALIESGEAVNGNFNGAWADTDNGAIGNVAGTVITRVPVGQRVALSNVNIIGPVSAYAGQRAGA